MANARRGASWLQIYLSCAKKLLWDRRNNADFFSTGNDLITSKKSTRTFSRARTRARGGGRKLLVTTSKALVTRSDALVPSSFLLLLVTSATLVVTSALLVVTKFAIRIELKFRLNL